ncbi:hypothetical protein BFW01_g9829 [Lasiodiplodia theobromae]|uniref:Peroxin 22-like protein n=1 Tax=Lasiodiplodia theobromae TaxID=45133 RepID=A0A5N5DI78_9PEZI|nr:Peroxin pex22-like protein [Lasiodiplodia theobromae]KAB2577545.1 hypothetical protein DBV05_g3693 [Lasiodiplodia theobromae]KAF4535647.1 Peroxin pex22-like protein [Lasiodiplodia theobromae]KAF9638932.1 hypothetical protein BFW01_g9829 [Lasiodiplodia theobromae]
MSFSYDRYDRRQQSSRRSTFGYWVPLVITVTIATAGVAAWVWSERKDGDDDDDADLSYGEEERTYRPPPPPGYAEDTYSESVGVTREQDEGFMARMSGAIRRTPSPQQVFDNASRRLAAGVAAAGTAFGAALGSIREEDREDYGDHSRWSEEAARRNVEAQSSQSSAAVGTHTAAFNAALQPPAQPPRPGARKKTVVVVVSADSVIGDDDHAPYQEHASILSHLPPTNFATTNLFVLIYAPSLKPRSSSSNQSGSLGSSYAAIPTPAQTPGDDMSSLDPHPYGSGQNTPKSGNTPSMSASTSESALYNSIYARALRLVKDRTMVMPFTTPSGHVHMLRHLAPDLVYVTEDLSGTQGEYVEQIRNWVGQVMVVVGTGGVGLGLVDTEDEGEGTGRVQEKKWWETTTMVGLGKGVEVVDGARLLDDFERRVGGKE